MRTDITETGEILDFDGQTDDVFHLGVVQMGASDFTWLASPSTTPATEGWFPQDGRFDVGDGVMYPGDYALALGRNIVYGYNGEFWGGAEASQWVNFYDDGLMVGRFGTYAGAQEASLPGFSGNATSLSLVYAPCDPTPDALTSPAATSDGRCAYLYNNDESNHGGTVRWRLDGWDSIAEIRGAATMGQIANIGP